MLIHVPPEVTVLAMDVHKNTISSGVLEAGSTSTLIDKISADDESVRRLIARFPDRHRVGACPTAAEEAVRDLCRARADMVIDLTRARHRLGKFLLRHGRVWRDGDNWTFKHHAWIRAQRFDEPALTTTFNHYQATLTAARPPSTLPTPTPRNGQPSRRLRTVSRLCAYRGVAEVGALTLASEVCDWRRFPTASMFMAFCGLVPSEHSSGERTQRGGITHAGNTHLRSQLVESAWTYRSRAPLSVLSSPNATPGLTPLSSPGHGRRSCVCAASSDVSTHARRSAKWSSPPSPASSPGSSGPK